MTERAKIPVTVSLWRKAGQILSSYTRWTGGSSNNWGKKTPMVTNLLLHALRVTKKPESWGSRSRSAAEKEEWGFHQRRVWFLYHWKRVIDTKEGCEERWGFGMDLRGDHRSRKQEKWCAVNIIPRSVLCDAAWLKVGEVWCSGKEVTAVSAVMKLEDHIENILYYAP